MPPFTILQDDIFLVSYPKSGNTWMRFLLSSLHFGKKVDWSSVNTTIPSIHNVSNQGLLNFPSPRILKSHQNYNKGYKKVIYLVRDVRDVVISYYYYHLHLSGKNIGLNNFDSFLDKFLLGKVYAGLWDVHVQNWLDNKDKIENGFLLLKYEDLINDIDQEVERILMFLHLSRTKKEIKETINWASFENMQNLERRKQKKPTNIDDSIPFVRKGQVNQWKTFLTDEQQNKMNNKFGAVLNRLGYDVM